MIAGIWALVPAKDFARGKSRLSPALSDGARASFARSLFDHVLGALAESGVLDGILVATDSPAVAEAARAQGAEVRLDAPGVTTLSAVVDSGLAQLAARGARAALVLMANLPNLRAEDVRQLVARLDGHDVVAVRAEDDEHTNALLLSPPDCLPTAFGRAHSFATHLTAAQAANLRVTTFTNPQIAFDVDIPSDFQLTLGSKNP